MHWFAEKHFLTNCDPCWIGLVNFGNRREITQVIYKNVKYKQAKEGITCNGIQLHLLKKFSENLQASVTNVFLWNF